MYDIPIEKPSEEFREMWAAAGKHLGARAAGSLSWLRSNLDPPFLEHLSFRLGNQLFFIHVTDVDGAVRGPGSLKGLDSVANGCAGVPCLLPMRHGAGSWEPVNDGWGLVHASTRQPVIPPQLVSDARIEMTDWELHDFGVQVVRDQLRKDGQRVMSSQSNPKVDPSLWFVGDAGPEWVVVRCTRYPEAVASKPSTWAAIARRCAPLSLRGNFASVSVANAEQHFVANASPAPLWRGHGMFVAYQGLEPVPSA